MKPAGFFTSRKVYRPAAVILALALLLLFSASVCSAGSPGAGGKVVVLVVDRVDASMFPSRDTPFCRELAGKWSAGLMVTRSGSRNTGEDIDHGGEYISLGSGFRARGARTAGFNFDSGELFLGYGIGSTAGEIFSGYTGFSPPDDGVVCLGWQSVVRANSTTREKEVGRLGELLGGKGIIAAVAGNEDDCWTQRRFAALICCDKSGVVTVGDVGARNVESSPEVAGGCETDVSYVIEKSRLFIDRADLLVVDAGDTGRVDREARFTGEESSSRQLSRALGKADRMARELCGMLDLERSLFLIVSPGAPCESREKGNFLTPVIAAGRGFGQGLLSSSSTHRPGIVSNGDFLPTVLSFFDIDAPDKDSGSTFTTREASGTLEYLERISSQLEVTREARWPIIITYLFLTCLVTALTVLFALGAAGKIRGVRRLELSAHVLNAAQVVLLAAPLSFMVVSAFSYGGGVFPIVFCLVFSLVVGLGAWVAFRGRKLLDPIVVICLLTGTVMLADLFTGGRLLMFPLWGVSAPEGMRYFGFSNVFVGLLIGVSVWSAAGLLGGDVAKKGVKIAAVLAMLSLSFIVGLGALGANIGGFITAVVTFTLFLVYASGRRLSGWRPAWVALATAFGTALVVLLDVVFFQSHAGKAVGGGVSDFMPMMGRKVGIHIGQISYFLVPALLLMAGVLVAVVWVQRPGSVWSPLWKRERAKTAAVFSILVGTIVAMIFNDTGITMMGVMILVSVLACSYYATSWMVSEKNLFLPGELPDGDCQQEGTER